MTTPPWAQDKPSAHLRVTVGNAVAHRRAGGSDRIEAVAADGTTIDISGCVQTMKYDGSPGSLARLTLEVIGFDIVGEQKLPVDDELTA